MIERAGSPAAGAPNCASASRQASGPTPQLTPIASTPAAVSASTAASGVVPSASTRSSPNVIDAMTGTSAAGARLVDREQQVAEVEEGLDDEEVGAALEQAVDLLPERRPDRRVVGVAELARRRPSGPMRAADPRVAAADVARLAGDLRRPAVEARRRRPRARTRRAGTGWRRT